MRTIHLAAFIVGLLALSVANATAETSPILNIIEVQKLVASETASDHARLAAHFSALADQSASEAKQHETMSKAFGGNPSRQLGASLSVHCTHLAKLNREAAATLGQLSAHHNKIAGGVSSALPPNAAAYQSGKGARLPTKNELRDLAARASSAADHRALMEYFNETARRHTATGDEHVRMAQSYRGTKIASAAAHCDRMVTLSRDAAKEATVAALMHKDLAGVPR
jgi:hypothetical protein